jgi:hypothetical protein
MTTAKMLIRVAGAVGTPRNDNRAVSRGTQAFSSHLFGKLVPSEYLAFLWPLGRHRSSIWIAADDQAICDAILLLELP